MNKKQIRKMQTASGGPINWLRKRIYTNIEPFGYNDIGSRLYNGIILNENEHNNFEGDYSDPERAPAQYQTIDNIWGEYLHIPEKERRYSNGKYKIKNNGNRTFSLPFESMEDIMLTVNSNNPLLWGQRGKALNSVVGEYDVHRGYDKNGDYLKYIDHWRINPYDVKNDKEYGQDNNSILKWYFKGKDDASFGLGTPVEIQGKYYLDDIYDVKGKDRGGHYLPEIVVTGKKKQGGKMNIIEFLKNGSGIHIKPKNRGKFTKYCHGKVTDACIRKAKASGNPTLVKRATFADNARHFKHRSGGKIDFYNLGGWFKNISNNVGSFLNSDMGKSIMSTGSSLLSLGKGISDTGKNIDQINKINEEINAEEAAAKQNSFAKKFATILQEKLSKPDIDVNGSPIHTNGVNVTNEAYNQAVNTFNFDNSVYNQMRYLNKMRGQQIQNQTSASMMGSVNNLINSIGGISESVLNNNKSTTT